MHYVESLNRVPAENVRKNNPFKSTLKVTAQCMLTYGVRDWFNDDIISCVLLAVSKREYFRPMELTG